MTQILGRIDQGDPAAARELLPLVYQELRKLAAAKMIREHSGQTLQATALVHEAYLRLVDRDQSQRWDGRGHFFVAAAQAMQRILVENARRKGRLKAGGEHQRVELSDGIAASPGPSLDVIALDEALTRFEQLEPRKAQLVRLRYFAGLTLEEAARLLGISSSTADNDWAYARAWLRLELSEADER